MTLSDIIECLNRSIQASVKGHFVLHTSILPNKTIKLYKLVTYTIWLVQSNSNTEVFTFKSTERISEENKQAVLASLEKQFVEKLFRWIQSDDYKNIIKSIEHEAT